MTPTCPPASGVSAPEAAPAERLQAAEAARAKAERELAALRAYVAALETRHAAVLASETWRAMEPVRRIMRLIRSQDPPKTFVPRTTGAKAALLSREKAADRISRAFAAGKSGFHQAGLERLAQIRAHPATDPRSLPQAVRSMILLRADGGDPAERALALEELAQPKEWGKLGRPALDAAAIRLSLLAADGRHEEARRLAAVPPVGAGGHADFLLLAASVADPAARVAGIAAAFRASAGIGIAPADPALPLTLDNLRGDPADNLRGDPAAAPPDAPLISVIVPAWNAADTILTSLASLAAQSWRNLEILVVDDASRDATAERVAAMAARDPRIRLIRLPSNGGAYAARNTALAEARGHLVTCQDADDWSHPARLARQATALLADPSRVANVSHWARATTDLVFERRPFTPRVVHFNSSSIMFRRAPVIAKIGFWDSVRFAGDTEFWHRLQAAFGPAAVAELPELLAIGRVRAGSLSRASASAYPGAKIGARKAYERLYEAWHTRAAPDGLHVPFPQRRRPFAVPAPMLTGRATAGHFDAVLISDFRHVGGTTASNEQELLAQTRAGIRTALVQVDRYGYDVDRGIHASVQALIDAGAVTELVYGDRVTADLAVVRFPPIFSHPQPYLPEITAKAVRVVMNQPPRRVAGEAPFYAIEDCRANVAAYLGQPGTWVPIGPAVRRALEADGEAHHLSGEDWLNIIDIDAWKVARPGWRDPSRPVIGRHGRDAEEKWLTSRDALLAAYPDDGRVRVRIMGGAAIPTRIIGHEPAHWEVLAFNAMTPRDFLAGLDFFVFFPHEGRFEAFGRTIIEAMASGCLTVLPPVFAELFGAAAVYATPAEVEGIVMGFFADRAAYLEQTARAEAIVRARFGFEQHVARVARAMDAPAPAGP